MSKNAVGICDRSGIKAPLKKLVPDGDSPGLMVLPEWRDEKNPQERPIRIKENIAVSNPRPDRDVEAGPATTNIAQELFPGQPYFGGDT